MQVPFFQQKSDIYVQKKPSKPHFYIIEIILTLASAIILLGTLK